MDDRQCRIFFPFGPNLPILVVHISLFILHTFTGIRYPRIEQILYTLDTVLIVLPLAIFADSASLFFP